MNKIRRSHSIVHQYPSLPSTFISSLRQLFSILDKSKTGSVPFVVFKRYFDTSSSTIDFLNDLEIESNANDNLITFPLLIHVIERAISTVKPSLFKIEHVSNPLYAQQRIDFPMV